MERLRSGATKVGRNVWEIGEQMRVGMRGSEKNPGGCRERFVGGLTDESDCPVGSIQI